LKKANKAFVRRSSIDFPDPRQTLAEGIVAVGGQLDVDTLYTAYHMGIFPWPQEGYPLLWFSPERRGILEFKDFKVPRSLQKFYRQNPQFQFSVNKDFRQVIEECAKQPRPGQFGTWILPAMKKGYVDFHDAGFAMSVEVFENNTLVGGIYGVLIEGIFSAESMFYKKSNASKLALWHLVDILQKMNHQWMDIQMVTPITEAFGGKYVEREVFLQMLKEVHQKNGIIT
jgi:leucyl/phenylalanyl-tRNA--protein transferase